MSDEPANRYIFSGHAIGAAARFNKLDDIKGVNHVVPALGASVLPVTGGVSRSDVTNYSYDVTVPRRRSLLSVARIESKAEGREFPDEVFTTNTQVRIESLTVLEKLYIDFIQVHVQAERRGFDGAPQIARSFSRIEGVHLGKVTANIILDDEALSSCATQDTFSSYLYKRKATPYLKKQKNGALISTIVQRIELINGDDWGKITTFEDRPNVIHWDGFGFIYFGEVIVKGDDRQVVMVRLQMGSDGGGTGTAGDAHSNGSSEST